MTQSGLDVPTQVWRCSEFFLVPEHPSQASRAVELAGQSLGYDVGFQCPMQPPCRAPVRLDMAKADECLVVPRALSRTV